MMSLPYTSPDGQVLITPHIIGSNFGPARVIGTGAIKSENFSSGSAGWSIDGDGNVEFNSGTFRGTLEAGSIDIGPFQVSSAGVLTIEDPDGDLVLDASDGLILPVKVSELGPIKLGTITWRNASDPTDEIAAITAYYDGNDNYLKLEAFNQTAYPGTGLGYLEIVALESYFSGTVLASSLYLGPTVGSGSASTRIQFGNSSTTADNLTVINDGSGTFEVYATTNTANVANRRLQLSTSTGDLTVTGNIVCNGGNDGGLTLRDWTANANYGSLATVNMTGNEYMVLSLGSHTFVSAAVGGNVYLRPDANSTTYQVVVTNTSVAATMATTASATTVRDAGFGVLGTVSSRAVTKENVLPVAAADALQRVLALRPVEFNFRQDHIGDGTNEMVAFDQKRGFIAEEVATIDRLATIYGWLDPDDPKKLAGPREEPLPLEDAVPIQWSSEAMVADLVAVVQDLHERIITLEAKK